MHLCQIGSRWWACLVAVATLAATLPVSTDAEARGGRAGFFQDLRDAGLITIELTVLIIKIVHFFFVKIGPWHISTSL